MNEIAYKRLCKDLENIGSLDDTKQAKQEINEMLFIYEKVVNSPLINLFKKKDQERLKELMQRARRIRFEILMRE